MTDKPESIRYHSLDAVRAFALLLGIVFHASISFLPMKIGWAIQDHHTSHFLSVFIFVSHSFRLEIFFLIAGFFARLLYYRRGIHALMRNRIKRILIPFIVGWLILRPLLVFGFILGYMKVAGEVNYLQALKGGLDNLISLQSPFTGSHLWFLYYLLLIYIAFFILRKIFVLCDSRSVMRTGMDRFFRWLMHSHWRILILAIPTVLFLMGMSGWHVDTPDKTLIPHIPVLLLYGFVFSIGWMLHRQADLLELFAKKIWINFALAAPVIIMAIFMILNYEKATEHENYALIRFGYNCVYALMMWLLVFGVMGCFIRFFSNSSAVWRYISDSSYWLYLVHLPLVIWLQVEFAHLGLHWTLKLFLINLISFILLFASYHYFVRSTFIGWVLNGRKYPFRLIPFASSNR